MSPNLDQKDNTAFRSIIEVCFYVGRERPDLMFKIAELACSMSSPTIPTIAALGHLRYFVGVMRQMGDVGVRLRISFPGPGKISSEGI